jgi:hypothetical protein
MKWLNPEDPIVPYFFLRCMFRLNVPVMVGSQLSSEYRSGDKKLPFVIFSHGLMANAMMYTIICKELASWGLAVFALDHLDQSCGYTMHQDFSTSKYHKVEVKFDTRYKFGDQKKREEQLGIRTDEISALIEQLRLPSRGKLFNLIEYEASEAVELDFDNIVVCGHSFGGITAMSYALETKLQDTAKVVIGLDAWWLPMNKRIMDEIVRKARPCYLSDKSPQTLMINTSKFPEEQKIVIPIEEFSQKDCNDKVIERSIENNAKFELVDIADSLHVCQCDAQVVMPFETAMSQGKCLPNKNH